MAGGLRLSERQIQKQLKEFESRLALIDLDSVVEESAKETAAELTQVVRDAVAAHPEISSPANLNSEYYQGSPATSAHPPLTQKRAWEVTQVGNDFRVSPVPNVRRKAMLMEFGRSAITTGPDNPMRFWVDGMPVFTHHVDAVKPKRYWRTAVRKIRADGALSDNMQEELEKEFREKGFRPRSL